VDAGGHLDTLDACRSAPDEVEHLEPHEAAASDREPPASTSTSANSSTSRSELHPEMEATRDAATVLQHVRLPSIATP
jgi:hypothetical protein